MNGLLGRLHPETQRLADAVYDRIGEAIIHGVIEPGTRIRDMEIAEDLGVSRMPVREALQRLERIGLVEMSASRFTRVTDISEGQTLNAIEYLGYQVAAAARMSAHRMSADARADAVAAARHVAEVSEGSQPESPDDIRRINDAISQLWTLLAEGARNDVFLRSYKEAWFALERAQRTRLTLVHPVEKIAELFLELAGEIEAGDPAGAERVIRHLFRIAEYSD